MHKKDISKLVKKVIVDKTGKKTTVYVVPDRFVEKQGYRPAKVVVKPKGRSITNPDAKVVKKKRTGETVIKKTDFKEKYSDKPVTYKLMTKKIIWSEKGVPKLTKDEWKKLVREHEGFIAKIAGRFNFGNYHGDKFKELQQVGLVGFLEGVQKYKEVYNPKNPYDFNGVVYNFVTGRVKTAISKELRSGIQIPIHLVVPMQEYKQVRDGLLHHTGKKPTKLDIARELQNKWTKKTFDKRHILAEDRKYYKVKGKDVYDPIDLISVESFNQKKNLFKKYELNHTKDNVKAYVFDELPEKVQKKLKEEDQLPLTGYTTSLGEGIIASKSEAHKKNIIKINEKYFDLENRLKETYELSSVTDESEYESRKKLLDTMLGDLKKEENKVKSSMDAYEKERENFANDIVRLNDGITNLDNKLKTTTNKKDIDIYGKQKEILLGKLRLTSDGIYQDKLFKPYITEIENARANFNKKKEDYDLAVKLYPTKPMSQSEYDTNIEKLKTDKDFEIRKEQKRFNSDKSSNLIPGILERINEFENIEALKELRLDISIDNESSDESYSPLETTFVPQLTPDEEYQIREEHNRAKQILVRGINDYLVPNLADTLKLHLGLHKESKRQEGEIWGELKNNKEIADWFKGKANTDEQIGEKIYRTITKKKSSEAEANAYLSSVPFLLPQFENRPNLVNMYWKNWLAKEPKAIASKTVKVKIETSKYKKLYKDFINKRKVSKQQFVKWKKANPKATMKQKKAKYEAIKETNKALWKHVPLKFEMKKVSGSSKLLKSKIEAWNKQRPKFTYDSDKGKEVWVGSQLDKARALIRTAMPVENVRNLIDAHRKMVKYGIIDKAIFENLNKSLTTKNKIYFNKAA